MVLIVCYIYCIYHATAELELLDTQRLSLPQAEALQAANETLEKRIAEDRQRLQGMFDATEEYKTQNGKGNPYLGFRLIVFQVHLRLTHVLWTTYLSLALWCV